MRRTERLRMTVVTALHAALFLGGPVMNARLSHGQETDAVEARTLLSQLSWLRVDVVSGKLEPRGFRSANVRIVQSRELPGGDTEELQLINDAGKASLRYERRGSSQRRVVLLDDQGRVRLRHETHDEAPSSFEYEQNVDQPLRMVVMRMSGRREYQTASIWHFAFEQPELAAGSLEPLIELVRPGWSLTREAAIVRETLQRIAPRLTVPERSDVERQVRQLASDRFADRKAADQRLRAWGPSVMPILEQIDATTLDREQRERLRGIKDALGLSGPDSPPRVAQRLAADPRVWTALLDGDSVEERRLAVMQLERLTGRSVGFNPDADAPVRAARRDELLNLRRWK